ncbi:MAG: hypothetical protein RAP70_03630 [Candidatus Celaenobacter antarcticus]|nr:hypothetical protein [Candidatus Celaenobacter antarcticus]
MIANEINRAQNWIEKLDFEKVSHCYERAFELIDLTVNDLKNKSFIRELLSYRELLATKYIQKFNDPRTNSGLLRVLLTLNSGSFNTARQ